MFNRWTKFIYILFNKYNITKIIIIFVFGFISRLVINYYFEINVFVDMFNYISFLYYLSFSTFVVFVHEYFNIYNISIVPDLFSISKNSFNFIKNNFNLSKINWKELNFTNVINTFLERVFNNFKLPLNVDSTVENINKSSNKLSIDDALNFQHKNRQSGTNDSTSKSKSIQKVSKTTLSLGLKDTDMYHNSKNRGKGLNPIQEWYKHNINPASSKSLVSPTNNPKPALNSNDFYFVPGSVVNTPNTNVYSDSVYSDQVPNTPRMGNLSTPSDLSNLTPLFNDVERFVGEFDHNDPNIAPTNTVGDWPIAVSINSENNSVVQEDLRSSSYTNDTNHGTVGSKSTSINWEDRRIEVHRRRLLHAAWEEHQLITHEVELKDKSKGKFKLGFKLLDNSLDKLGRVYVKYHDMGKRKLFWNLWERDRGNYGSYPEFKAEFDPKTNIWKEIWKATKTDVSKEVNGLIRSNPFSRTPLEGSDIRRVGVTYSQAELNRINAAKYNPQDLEHRKIKHRQIKMR